MTITVSPSCRFPVGYRVHSLLSASGGDRIVVGSHGDRVFVLDGGLRPLHAFQAGGGMKAAAVSGDGRWLVLTNRTTLAVRLLDGQQAYEENTSTHIGQGFDGCVFSADGSSLWVARHVGQDRVEIQVRDTRSWQVMRQAVLEEPAPPTGFFLSLHPENRVVVVWAAAGQDGQWVYWAHDDGSQVHVHEAPRLVETTPPEFHPSGSEFLVVREGALVRYGFPDCTELGRLDWFGSEEQVPDEACYLSDHAALVGSSEGCLYLVDLQAMRVVGDVHLLGHEPRPCRELHPILKDEHHLATDLQWFRRVGYGRVVSVHRKLPTEDHSDEKWRDVVVAWEPPHGLGDFTRPDSTSPYSSILIGAWSRDG
jgi:hypothetical protein